MEKQQGYMKYNILGNYTKEDFIKLVSECNSRKEILLKVGLRAAGSNFRTLNKYLNKYNLIDILNEKIKFYKVNLNEHNNLITLEKLKTLLVKNSKLQTSKAKKYLFKYGLKENKCEICGLAEWQNKPLNLQLHHIDGIYNNHEIENLQIICPNCHSQTENFVGKNIQRTKAIFHCECGNQRSRYANKCKQCSNKIRRKNTYPAGDELRKQVKEMGYAGTGRYYSVSGTTIKKWIKAIEGA